MTENGWRKVGVDVNASYPGDDALGDHFTAYYEKPGTDWKAELTYYAVGFPDPMGGGPLEEYGVDCMSQVYRRASDEDEPRDETTEYEPATALSICTLEDAVTYACECAERDESHVFTP